MRMRHPWWPHLDIDPIFNPFIPVTARRPTDDHVELFNEHEEEGQDEEMPERILDPSSAEK